MLLLLAAATLLRPARAAVKGSGAAGDAGGVSADGAAVQQLPRPAPDDPIADPDFTDEIRNATVAVGREAVLSCPVSNLGPYKVGWLRAEDQTVLALHDKVVTHNARITVSHDGERTWRLHIRQVKETDRGCYMCQINTSVMKKQLGCLDVLVPPDIVDDATSSDVTVREGDDATLVCRATGKPAPRVVWRREDGEPMLIRSGPREVAKLDTVNGDELRLSRLDRRQMAAYLCIASNDVPPAVSKRITLNVNFAPVIKVPNQLVGAPLGTDVQLECFVEAFPNTINYWVKNRGEMLLDGVKHHVEEERFSYKVHLRLTIRNITAKDLGTYTCVSTNSLGHNDGTVRLYEIKVPTRPPTTTTIMPETTVPVLKTTTPRLDRTNALILTTSPPLQAMVAASPVEPLPQPPGPSRDLPGVASASGAAGAAGAGASVSSGARRGAVSRAARAALAPGHWLLPLLLLPLLTPAAAAADSR